MKKLLIVLLLLVSSCTKPPARSESEAEQIKLYIENVRKTPPDSVHTIPLPEFLSQPASNKPAVRIKIKDKRRMVVKNDNSVVDKSRVVDRSGDVLIDRSKDKSKEVEIDKSVIKDRSRVDSGNKTVTRGGIPWYFILLMAAAVAFLAYRAYRALFL
jgi:hypothetical protein